MSHEAKFQAPKRQELPADLKYLKLQIPASSANLGPGFDTFALAFQLYLNLEFQIEPAVRQESGQGSQPVIILEGSGAETLPRDKNNLVYATMAEHWPLDNTDLLRRLKIRISSQIPLTRGLGSSAAAIVGAFFAAAALANGKMPSAESVLEQATSLEGHADNVSASLFGGLTLCSLSAGKRQAAICKLQWPGDWRCLALVPGYELSTAKARSVLPPKISRQDAVFNLQKAAMLVAAVQNRNEDLLKEALQDRLHEPYREELVPELSQLRAHLSSYPQIGCVLSGAGPSVLVVVNRRHKDQVLQAMKIWSEKRKPACSVLDLEVDQEGLKVAYE